VASCNFNSMSSSSLKGEFILCTSVIATHKPELVFITSSSFPKRRTSDVRITKGMLLKSRLHTYTKGTDIISDYIKIHILLISCT